MKIRTNYRWVIKIVLISIAAAMIFALISTEILGRAGYVIVFATLLVFIALGVIFDMIAIAVTAAPEASFHSMAAHREQGAAEALKLKKNADRVTSFCNDVVGDVTGIIGGAMAALIAARLVVTMGYESIMPSLIMTGAVTGLSVGGKALVKAFAFNKSTAIVLRLGKSINFFKRMRVKGH